MHHIPLDSQDEAVKRFFLSLPVDPQGSVTISCPDQARLIQFGADGQKLRDLPVQGNGAPVGVAVAPDGRLLVADARGNVVDAISAP